MIRRGIGVQSFAAVAGGYTPSDADALAFVNAAEITNDTQKQAINTLVTDIKGYGIWTKMKAIYPFVGGTASAHKFNLKDPRDLDAAFRLVFSGGWTHSSNGALPNGTNGFGDTKFNASSFNNLHYSYYSRTTNTVGREIGTETGFGYDLIISLGGTAYSRFGSSQVISSNSDSKGFYILTEASTLQHKYFKNNTTLGTTSYSGGSYANLITFLGAINRNGSAANYGSRECAFASIGDGLTDTEAANFYTAVQAYQTTLSRNV